MAHVKMTATITADILASIQRNIRNLPTRLDRLAAINRELSRLHVPLNDDEGLPIAESVYEEVVKPFVAPEGPPRSGPGGPAGGFQALAAAPLDPEQASLRQELFPGQPAEDVRRRGIFGAFGAPESDFAPQGRAALGRSFQQFQDVLPITRFFSDQEAGPAFSSFLEGNRLSPDALRERLKNILALRDAGVSGGAGGAQQFGNVFTDPIQTATAAATPFTQELAPRIRQRALARLVDPIRNEVALAPEKFRGEAGEEALAELIRRFLPFRAPQFEPGGGR